MTLDRSQAIKTVHDGSISTGGCRCGGRGNFFRDFDDKTRRRYVHVFGAAAQEIWVLIASVVPPGRAPGANARLERNAAIVTRAAANIAPDDAIATFHRCAQNVGALTVDRFDDAARLMSGNDRQRVTIRQWTMPAVHVGAAKGRGSDFH